MLFFGHSRLYMFRTFSTFNVCHSFEYIQINMVLSFTVMNRVFFLKSACAFCIFNHMKFRSYLEKNAVSLFGVSGKWSGNTNPIMHLDASGLFCFLKCFHFSLFFYIFTYLNIINIKILLIHIIMIFIYYINILVHRYFKPLFFVRQKTKAPNHKATRKHRFGYPEDLVIG